MKIWKKWFLENSIDSIFLTWPKNSWSKLINKNCSISSKYLYNLCKIMKNSSSEFSSEFNFSSEIWWNGHNLSVFVQEIHKHYPVFIRNRLIFARIQGCLRSNGFSFSLEVNLISEINVPWPGNQNQIQILFFWPTYSWIPLSPTFLSHIRHQHRCCLRWLTCQWIGLISPWNCNYAALCGMLKK